MGVCPWVLPTQQKRWFVEALSPREGGGGGRHGPKWPKATKVQPALALPGGCGCVGVECPFNGDGPRGVSLAIPGSRGRTEGAQRAPVEERGGGLSHRQTATFGGDSLPLTDPWHRGEGRGGLGWPLGRSAGRTRRATHRRGARGGVRRGPDLSAAALGGRTRRSAPPQAAAWPPSGRGIARPRRRPAA